MYSRLESAGVGPDMKRSETPVAHSQCAQRDLIRRLRAGSAIAFRDFVELYQSQVYRVAYAITAQRDHAEEVAQRAFVKAYFSIKNFNGRGSLYAWIYRMAVDEAFLFLRNKRADTYPRPSRQGHGPCDDLFAERLYQQINGPHSRRGSLPVVLTGFRRPFGLLFDRGNRTG